MAESSVMNSAQSHQDAAGSPKARSAELEEAVEATALQNGRKERGSEASEGDGGDVEGSNGVERGGKQGTDTINGGFEHVDGVAESDKVSEEVSEVVKENGVDKEQQELVEGVSNGHLEPVEKASERLEVSQVSDEVVQTVVKSVSTSEKTRDVVTEEVIDDMQQSEQHMPTPAVHINGVDMIFPEDEVPIELCPFSSDCSVETARSTRAASIDSSPGAKLATPVATPQKSAPATPTSATTEEPATQTAANRTVGKRKRRKKLSYSAARSMTVTKMKQELKKLPSPPPAEEKLSISTNGYAAENEIEIDADENPPPSPVYPDADASHLYPSHPEGAPWRWEDCDPYFSPLEQSDLDNLVRWRKDCANVVAAYSAEWRGVSGIKTMRAQVEAMVADASDATAAHVELPARRGRSYHDVWEETDFLAKQKRSSSIGENLLKSQVVKKKRKSVTDAEGTLLSHRDLVYGYDDDLFQAFRGRLGDRVKACQVDPSPPATPPTPPVRRQSQSSNAGKTDGSIADIGQQEVLFDEEVLPSLPCRQFHPASLGLWKLRKNQVPEFSVVHPASVNRSAVPARWKEEMKRHHQQQYELQLQLIDAFGDPSDGDDEGTGGSTDDRHRPTLFNRDVNGGLPSFGENVEEDEISRALSASVAKLIPLSMYNWRIAQLVYERAACNIQCAPILEGEAAAARELEDVYIQLCPPGEVIEDAPPLPNGAIARHPRGIQINSVPYDLIAYSLRRDIADNCSLAVAASVEFALGVNVGDVVDVLDRNGCWNYGEIIEIYSENTQGIPKFLLLRFSLWAEDTVEWIAVSEGRLLPRGVADGSRPCTVGPTRAHRGRVRYDQNLARELERSFPQRRAKQGEAAAEVLAHRQHNALVRSSSNLLKTPQKRKRKRPGKSAAMASTV